MRTSLDVHHQLLSLGRIALDGRSLAFSQASICLIGDSEGSWSCSLRGLASGQLDELAGGLRLQAQTLDGREVEGQACVSEPTSQSDEDIAVELVGLGPLLVDGRRL